MILPKIILKLVFTSEYAFCIILLITCITKGACMQGRMTDDRSPQGVHSEICVNEFTEDSATDFRKKVLFRAEMDPDAPIVIYIDSYGGYVDSLAKMIETMNEVPNKFITVSMGKAISCGAILLSHGDVRYCGGYSRVMIHNVSAGSWGEVYSLKASSDQTMEMNKRFMGLLANNCKMTYEELQKKIKETDDSREIWLNAEDAKKFGIVDEIGIPSLIPMLGWEVQTIVPRPLNELPTKKTKKKATKKKASKKKTTKKKKRS
jgi:ATP-dependent Clp protease protease subunit